MLIEGAPFYNWEKLKIVNGGKTADSVVGFVELDKRSWVVKWNRKWLYELDKVIRIALYMRKAYALYVKVLGSDFIVSSFFSIGEKITRRGKGIKESNSSVKRGFKLYTFQPFIKNAFPANKVPVEILLSDSVRYQWNILRPRLYDLYTTARRVNRESSEVYRFPIGLSLGPVRQIAYSSGNFADFKQQLPVPPPTPNILITKNYPYRIFIVDLGTYFSWDDSMRKAYNQIWDLTTTV